MRHDEILKNTVETHGGYVFKTVGDAFCAAFASARAATLATLAAQRALFVEDWDENCCIRVRMALHTGAATERDGDYFGPAVNRVARLLSAGHGGQVLLSAVTYGLARDDLRHLEPGAELRDLGEYRLRDLRYTERIFQLVVPDLPADFPPPKGEPVSPSVSTTGDASADASEEPTAPGPPITPAPRAGMKAREEGSGDERYRRIRPIGGGGMAEVYLARDELLDRDVALKVLRGQYADDAAFVERFRREARNAAALSHPNIVAIHDRGKTGDGAYYIVMEHVEGGTLKELIQREGPLPPGRAASIAIQVARALRVAHERGVIHRDIKPENILLTASGEVKVADFGIAHAASMTRVTQEGFVLGSAYYLSPEQAMGSPVGPQSDLYSLGIVLYEMLTGELPFEADTPVGIVMQHVSGRLRPPREVNPRIPEEFEAIAMRLLAKDPQQRYPSAAELAADLEWARQGDTLPAGVARRGTSNGTSALARPPGAPSRSPGGVAPPVAVGVPPGSVPPGVPPAPPPRQARPGDYGNRRPWLLGAAGLLAGLATLVGVGLLVWFLAPSYFGDETLEVPTLEGETLATARQQVGEDFELISSEEVSGEPEGTIISQDPEPGAEAPRGEDISVVVSTGTETIALPNVVGMLQYEAEERLSSRGFEVETETRESSEEDAGRVVEQSPSGNEAEEGSEVALVVGEAPQEEAPPPEEAPEPPAPKTDYASITDDTGALRVEVPREWSDTNGGPWIFESNEVGPAILAAPDLHAWTTHDSAPGVLFGASSTLVGEYDEEEVLDLYYDDASDGCEYAGREPYERGDFTGYKDVWTNCGGAGTRAVQVAAAPEDRSFLLTVQIGITSEMDPEIEDRILDSFEVVGAV